MFVCLFGPVSSIFISLFFTASFLDHNSNYALLLLLFLLLLTVVPSLVSLGYDAVVACSSTVQLLSCLDRALSSLKKKKKKVRKPLNYSNHCHHSLFILQLFYPSGWLLLREARIFIWLKKDTLASFCRTRWNHLFSKLNWHLCV